MKGHNTMNNETTANKLTKLLRTLPQRNITGLTKHMGHIIKTDPKSKGKSVLFTWNTTTFKLTENLKVYELDFTNSWVKSAESINLENMLKDKNIISQIIVKPVIIEQEKTDNIPVVEMGKV